MSVFHNYNTQSALQAALALHLQNVQNVLVSGGSVLKLLPWGDLQQAQIWLADERYVPATDKNSNAYALAQHAPASHLHLWDTATDIETSLAQRAADTPDTWDAAVLGVGPDGHIMSWFPSATGQLAQTDKSNLTAHTRTHTFAVTDRLTYAPQALARARTVLLVTVGESKRDIVEQLKSGEASTPAGQLLATHAGARVFYSPEN